jgi:hypothetical protein
VNWSRGTSDRERLRPHPLMRWGEVEAHVDCTVEVAQKPERHIGGRFHQPAASEFQRGGVREKNMAVEQRGERGFTVSGGMAVSPGWSGCLSVRGRSAPTDREKCGKGDGDPPVSESEPHMWSIDSSGERLKRSDRACPGAHLSLPL